MRPLPHKLIWPVCLMSFMTGGESTSGSSASTWFNDMVVKKLLRHDPFPVETMFSR